MGWVSFDYLKVCSRLVVVGTVHFEYRKACWTFVEGGRVRFFFSLTVYEPCRSSESLF